MAEAQPSIAGQIISKCSAGNPSTNAEGTRIACMSQCDLTGSNADKTPEISLFDTASGTFNQITNSSGCNSVVPSINSAGSRIAFTSGCNLTGGNPDQKGLGTVSGKRKALHCNHEGIFGRNEGGGHTLRRLLDAELVHA